MPTDQGQNFEKIHKTPSTKWLLLGTGVRGVGYDMLRACDRATGFVCDSLDTQAIMLRINSHPDEGELVARGVKALLKAGFVLEHKGCLYIAHHFNRSQDRKAAHAEYMRSRRKTRSKRESSGKPNSSNSPNSSNFSPKSPNSSNSKSSHRTDTAGELAQDESVIPVRPSRGKREERDQRSISDPSDPREVSAKPKRAKHRDNPDENRVFDFWRKETGHLRARLDPKRRSRIRARLKDFTADELESAIRNRRNDPFLMGENDTGRVYDDIPTLLRDVPQVERLLGLTKPQRERDRAPEDPDWAAKRQKVLAATERQLAREEAERRASLQRQTDALRSFPSQNDPSPTPGTKNARAPDSEPMAEVIDIATLAGRIGR